MNKLFEIRKSFECCDMRPELHHSSYPRALHVFKNLLRARVMAYLSEIVRYSADGAHVVAQRNLRCIEKHYAFAEAVAEA